MNAEQRSLLKIFDIMTSETAITDILEKMSDAEFNLLKKRIIRA